MLVPAHGVQKRMFIFLDMELQVIVRNPYRVLEPNSDLLEEEEMLFATEISLQSLKISFFFQKFLFMIQKCAIMVIRLRFSNTEQNFKYLYTY